MTVDNRKFLRTSNGIMHGTCCNVYHDIVLQFHFQVWLIRSPVRSKVHLSRIFVRGFAVYLIHTTITLNPYFAYRLSP